MSTSVAEAPSQGALLTKREATQRLRISLSYLDKLIHSERVAVIRFGRLVRVPLEEIERIEREGI